MHNSVINFGIWLSGLFCVPIQLQFCQYTAYVMG